MYNYRAYYYYWPPTFEEVTGRDVQIKPPLSSVFDCSGALGFSGVKKIIPIRPPKNKK